jgi:hypothetical protein
MNFETRQFVIDTMTEWEDSLFQVFDRTERPNWEDVAEELKEMFSYKVNDILRAQIHDYGYFD